MKKITLSLFFVLLAFITNAQTHLYENPNFDAIAKNHKLIGVIPFKATVTLRPKQMQDITVEQLHKMEVAEGEEVQNAMYSWFLKREKRGELTVKVQSPSITNVALKKAEITIDNFENYTPSELAKIIGVDAIVMGTFETNKPMSEGAAVALAVLFGAYGSTNKAVINMNIFNAADNELLLNYNKAVSGSLGSSSEDLINTIMRKVTRRMSYTR